MTQRIQDVTQWNRQALPVYDISSVVLARPNSILQNCCYGRNKDLFGGIFNRCKITFFDTENIKNYIIKNFCKQTFDKSTINLHSSTTY